MIVHTFLCGCVRMLFDWLSSISFDLLLSSGYVQSRCAMSFIHSLTLSSRLLGLIAINELLIRSLLFRIRFVIDSRYNGPMTSTTCRRHLNRSNRAFFDRYLKRKHERRFHMSALLALLFLTTSSPL